LGFSITLMPTHTQAPASDRSISEAAEHHTGEKPRNKPFNKRAGQRRGPRADQGQGQTRPQAAQHAPRTSTEPRKAPAPRHPTLEQLAQLYPNLFGRKLLPLKRGVLQELQQLHADVIAKEDLKLALTLHTRSTRYLAALASGEQRHDLQGQSVEVVSPEHRYHALLELYRRRQHRSEQDLSAELRQRIIEAAEASGLAPADYASRVRSKDETTNAQLEAAIAEWSERIARDEARLRAFEASGQTVKQFAEMYGLNLIETAATLTRARHRRHVPAPTAAAAATTTD
jgi:sRNA-binding protein